MSVKQSLRDYEAALHVAQTQGAGRCVGQTVTENGMDKYTKQDLDSEISVKLTLRDLIILSWGHESVSFVPGSEEETEFRDAEAKIDAALATLRAKRA